MNENDGFIYVRERHLPYDTFDADNHLYENRDALTKFIPKEYEGIIRYVDIGGRTKIAVRDVTATTFPTPPSNAWACQEGSVRTSLVAATGDICEHRSKGTARAGRKRQRGVS